MLEKFKSIYQKNKIIYLILLLMIFIFTGMFLINRFGIDTYFLEGYGYRNNAITPYLRDGRLFMTLFLGVMGFFNVSFQTAKLLSCVIAMVTLWSSMILVYHMIDKHVVKHTVLKVIASFALIFNIFVLEFFMFPEYTGVMSLGILFTTIATYFIVLFFESKNKKYFLLSYLAAFLSAFCYQGCLSLLVIIPIAFTLKYAKTIKQFVANNLLIAVGYAIPAFTTLVVSKLLGSIRTGSGLDIGLAVSKIADGLDNLMIGSFHFLPEKAFLIFSSITIILVVIAMVKNKTHIKNYFFLVYILMAALIVPLVPHLMVNPDGIWLVPRSNIGLGLILVIPILYYLIYEKKDKYIMGGLITLMIVFFCFQFYGAVTMFAHQQKGNILDYQEAKRIEHIIREYEETHKPVHTIVAYASKSPVYMHDGVIAAGDVNMRVFSTEWATRSIVSFIMQRNLEEGKKNPDVAKECEEKIAEDATKNHVIFKDRTVSICTY